MQPQLYNSLLTYYLGCCGDFCYDVINCVLMLFHTEEDC